jgi:hypothetical protein
MYTDSKILSSFATAPDVYDRHQARTRFPHERLPRHRRAPDDGTLAFVLLPWLPGATYSPASTGARSVWTPDFLKGTVAAARAQEVRGATTMESGTICGGAMCSSSRANSVRGATRMLPARLHDSRGHRRIDTVMRSATPLAQAWQPVRLVPIEPRLRSLKPGSPFASCQSNHL